MKNMKRHLTRSAGITNRRPNDRKDRNRPHTVTSLKISADIWYRGSTPNLMIQHGKDRFLAILLT